METSKYGNTRLSPIKPKKGQIIKERSSPLKFFKIKEREVINKKETIWLNGDFTEIDKNRNFYYRCPASVSLGPKFNKLFRIATSNELFRLELAILGRKLK